MSNFSNTKGKNNLRPGNASERNMYVLTTLQITDTKLAPNNKPYINVELQCPPDGKDTMYWVNLVGFSKAKGKKLLQGITEEKNDVASIQQHDLTFDLSLRALTPKSEDELSKGLDSRFGALKKHGFEMPEEARSRISAAILARMKRQGIIATASNGRASPLAEALVRPVAGVTSGQQQR